MARIFLMLHLVAVFVGVQVVGTYTSYGGGADNNGHAAKKSPMDYSRYADDVRNIANHDSDHNLHRSNACDDRFELKNSTIIRTKDSMFSGAQFVDDTKVSAATECRRLCCDKDDDCDTAVFVDDIAKDKNCFLFKCRIDDSMKCKFSSHVGYVSAMVGGFDVVARSGVQTESDRGNDDDDDDDDNERQQARDEGDVKKTGFDVKQDAAATPENDGSNQDEEADVEDEGCRDDQIQCANGDCIIARYVCNDVEDCTDGSDEMGCKYGSWKHWNNYNHPDSTYPGDDRDRSDEGLSRENEVDDAVNQGDAQDGSEGNDASQDKGPEDSVVPTGNDNEHSDNDDSQDVPPQSSPKPAVDPLKEVSSAPVDSKGDGAHPPSAAAAAVPKVVSGKSQVSTPKSVDLGDPTLRKATPHGIQPATSAILPLAVGLIITLFLLMMLSCRLRYMNRRLRYGRLKTHAHDADYLINGMYL